MKLVGFIFIFALAFQAHAKIPSADFQSLKAQYQKAKKPSQKQLKNTKWKYIGLANNHDLVMNSNYQDQFDFNGLKNSDGSQMMWSFDSYDSPSFELTLSRINALENGEDFLLSNVYFADNSLAFDLSMDEASEDLYVQNCRIYKRKYLICPITLKAKDNSAESDYSWIQVFTRY